MINWRPQLDRRSRAAWTRWRRSHARRLLALASAVLAVLVMWGTAGAQEPANQPAALTSTPPSWLSNPQTWTTPQGLSSTLQVMLLLTVISLAPAMLVMTTCFVRIICVLGILRQALGTQQLPPGQVLTSIAMFMTLAIMSPVWKQVYHDAIVPYTNQEISLEQAWDAGVAPVRRFMSLQIERTGNHEDVWLFLEYLPNESTPETYEDVPLEALLPAFMLSELKTSFLIGFQIYLPFIILDLVIASVLIAMGMMMLPPVLVSLPFKLLLFVLVDGWHLVVGMLLETFEPFT
ncbi:MAG: flagellar type III secretion system pore protein FliP [Pirellulales bacterium]|nr:flagellar type III secretion system pore protein FliP [Pirellulales bacterium]